MSVAPVLEHVRWRVYTLEDFVAACNSLLNQYLPDEYDGTRAREDVTVRTVRHYAGEGLIDEPLKDGREARYTHRHLVQVLAVRRLMAEGYTAKTIAPVTRRDTDELERVLRGEPVQPQTIQAGTTGREDALAYLERIRSRAAPVPTPPPAPASSAKRAEAIQETSSTPITPATWARYELSPGLELSVRDDARVPRTPSERTNLLERLEVLLTHLARR